jgi:CHASE2 domain-containing sensor protein
MVGGIGLLLAGNPIARFLGVESAGFLAMLGGVVMVYALVLLRGTARPSIRALGLTVALLNTAWVVVSVALLLGGWLPLTAGGKWAIAITAAIVATFALVQFYALRRTAR